MKVLFINSVVDYGSTGKIVRDLYQGLIETGHEAKMVYGRHEARDGKDTVNISNKLSSGYHLVMSQLLGRHGMHSSQATRKVIREIETFQPDIIHLHNIHGYYLNVFLLFEYLKNHPSIKIVWTLHDCWSFSGSSAYFSYDGCKKWDEGCVICNDTNTYPKNRATSSQERNFYKKKEAFTSVQNMTLVTPSDWLKNLTEQTFLKKYPVQRIYNGIDLNQFKPLPEESTDKKIILGVSNIWEKRKGYDDFIALSKLLSDDYQIVLIGLNKDQLANLPSEIVGIERTSNIEELVSYYSKAYVMLNLSVEETMGLTTVESLACGTPVIVYDQTAVPEVVNEHVGFVVEAGDVQRLHELIVSGAIETLDKQIVRDFALQFDRANMVNNYLNLYKKIMEQ